jgi:predicted lipoprotein with Yx(FWY)xxD motif
MSVTRAAIFGAAAVLGLTLVSACGQAPTTAGSANAVPDAQKLVQGKIVSLTSAKVGDLGQVLTGSNGKTLYRFDKDETNPPTSNCYDDCATQWPPATAPDGDLEVQGVDKALVSIVERKDGAKQLAVAGWPLYEFAQDTAPGDAKGHGIGDVWFAATPEGKKAGANAVPVLATAVVPGLGTVLTSGTGQTVYRFDKDTATPSVSNCDADCAKKFPPVLTTSDDIAVQGVDKTLLGTITRSDGTKQVTAKGWPLYTSTEDKAPGDAKSQGFKDTWFAAAPDGQKATENGELALTTASVGDLGTVLTDKDGMTLYRFDKDTPKPSVSNCAGDCAAQWPPALVTSDGFDVQGVDKALVGTITRADGGKQLTIAGWPLYTFAQDKVCGEAKGQGVGGVWFVSTPDGKKAGV